MSLCYSFKAIELSEYDSAQTFEWGVPGVTVELDVLNEAVLFAIKTSATGESGSGQWGQELYIPPQHRTISRQNIYGIRFRKRTESTENAPFVSFEVIAEAEAWPNLEQIRP